MGAEGERGREEKNDVETVCPDEDARRDALYALSSLLSAREERLGG